MAPRGTADLQFRQRRVGVLDAEPPSGGGIGDQGQGPPQAPQGGGSAPQPD